MSQIKSITYQRVKNLGNFESERIELTAELNEDDNPEEVTCRLKKLVFKALNICIEEDKIDF